MYKKRNKYIILIILVLIILSIQSTAISAIDINSIEEYENKKTTGVIIIIIIFFIFLITCIIFRKKYDKQGFYYRDIPCDGDIYYIYSLIWMDNINPEDDSYCINLINAKILEWYFKGVIDIYDKKIEIKDKSKIENELDQDLLSIVEKSRKFNLSKEENKELAKEMFKWIMKIDKYKKNIYKTIEGNTKKQDILKIKGLKNYLNEYSYIDEKNIKDVKIWEEYLVIANLLGISEKIEKNMPQYIIQNNVKLNLAIIKEIVKYLFNIG